MRMIQPSAWMQLHVVGILPVLSSFLHFDCTVTQERTFLLPLTPLSPQITTPWRQSHYTLWVFQAYSLGLKSYRNFFAKAASIFITRLWLLNLLKHNLPIKCHACWFFHCGLHNSYRPLLCWFCPVQNLFPLLHWLFKDHPSECWLGHCSFSTVCYLRKSWKEWFYIWWCALCSQLICCTHTLRYLALEGLHKCSPTSSVLTQKCLQSSFSWGGKQKVGRSWGSAPGHATSLLLTCTRPTKHAIYLLSILYPSFVTTVFLPAI